MAESTLPEAPTLLLAIAVLLAKQYQPTDKDARSVEIVLADAGIGYRDIAAIVGKQPDAVRVAIARARTKER